MGIPHAEEHSGVRRSLGRSGISPDCFSCAAAPRLSAPLRLGYSAACIDGLKGSVGRTWA
jgi:hypothetical protein